MEQANKSLSYHLDEIQNINSALADSSKIKEEYVGLYMEQYTNYITQIDSFKKRALKIAKSEDINKVVSFLKSSLNTEGDLAEFYNNFDKAILNLFPNFRSRLQCALITRKCHNTRYRQTADSWTENLCTNSVRNHGQCKNSPFLAIFAVYHYNYRSKMRSKAIGDRNSFEERVGRIGQ